MDKQISNFKRNQGNALRALITVGVMLAWNTRAAFYIDEFTTPQSAITASSDPNYNSNETEATGGSASGFAGTSRSLRVTREFGGYVSQASVDTSSRALNVDLSARSLNPWGTSPAEATLTWHNAITVGEFNEMFHNGDTLNTKFTVDSLNAIDVGFSIGGIWILSSLTVPGKSSMEIRQTLNHDGEIPDWYFQAFLGSQLDRQLDIDLFVRGNGTSFSVDRISINSPGISVVPEPATYISGLGALIILGVFGCSTRMRGLYRT